jgi:hypothetical protein
MKILVSKKVMRAATEDAIYLEDMQHHPEKFITCRGIPFWNKHAARKMLIKHLVHLKSAKAVISLNL